MPPESFIPFALDLGIAFDLNFDLILFYFYVKYIPVLKRIYKMRHIQKGLASAPIPFTMFSFPSIKEQF